MFIQKVSILGFRNFANCEIAFAEKSLIIGSNDIGKTNLIAGLRRLLDRSLSELDIEPCESDFHIDWKGTIADKAKILIQFAEVTEDAVLASFPGKISAKKDLFLCYEAERKDLSFRILAGHSEKHLEELNSRYYLKHLCMKVVDSRRDLAKFIQSEKKYLLKVAQESRTPQEEKDDKETLQKLTTALGGVNKLVGELNYVAKATGEVNAELKSLAHHNSAYSVQLNSTAVDVPQFVERLELAGKTNGASVSLGGDGRNNQILLALWKAKTAREFDHDNEVVIYCIEEPEAHLHPHQQRKLASYLTGALKGQTVVTTHSPQIVSGYSPDNIIRLRRDQGATRAASNGCSKCISDAWDKMGYRMSILPAEAFFASAVLLVEGPSELLFYRELAKRLEIDLDYYNLSILSVDGVAFEVYAQILNAMEIPFALRTDNDVSDISIGPKDAKKTLRQLAGINRCLSLVGEKALPHRDSPYSQADTIADGTWANVAKVANPKGVYFSKMDLENDLGSEVAAEFVTFKGGVHEAVKYLQGSKAIRMREFLAKHGTALKGLKGGELAKPLLDCVKYAEAVETL